MEIKYSQTREIKTFAYTRVCAERSLKRAESHGSDFYEIINTMVFSAFTLEGYLNHVGRNKITFWEDIEMVSFSKKLKIITDLLDIEIDKSRRPFQTITTLTKFRNNIAHGKTDVVEGEKVVHESEVYKDIVHAEWEKNCNIKMARIAFDDVIAIIEMINKSLYKNSPQPELQQYELWFLGGGESVQSPVSNK